MSLRFKLAASLAAAILVLVVGAVSYYANEQSRRAAALVDHTNLVRVQLERTLGTVIDAETGQRGYLLTGDSSYLAAYATARTDVDHEIATLRTLTDDNPLEQLRLDSLSLATDAKLVEMGRTIALAASGQRDSAITIMQQEHAAGDTRRIRRLIAAMEATEADLLAARSAQYTYQKRVSSLVIVLGSLMAATFSIIALASVRTSVTELEQANAIIEGRSAERERLILALARSNQELDQFAYVASHDLKAPLRGIAHLSQWVEEDMGDGIPSEARAKMNLLRGRVHRLEALIDGILQYSRAGRTKAAVEHVDVGVLVHEVVELLAPPPEISVTIARDMPTVQSERTPLQQVFMNLISNAIKYNHRPGATIRISSHDAGGMFHEFSVTDNGPGIAEEYHERIFGIFQTLESRDRVEGTGIGLSVVKKTVELRGGTVGVTSAPGGGATFTFEWPRAAVETSIP